MISTVYAKTTRTKINISMKGSGEALAQLIAEKDHPKTDIWFGGTGDPHLQAAEQGLSLEYKPATLPQLQGWALSQVDVEPHGQKEPSLVINKGFFPFLLHGRQQHDQEQQSGHRQQTG